MNILYMVAKLLLIIGGINWGLVGLVDLNLVDMLAGGTGLDRLIYILVGVSAVLQCCCWGKSCNIE